MGFPEGNLNSNRHHLCKVHSFREVRFKRVLYQCGYIVVRKNRRAVNPGGLIQGLKYFSDTEIFSTPKIDKSLVTSTQLLPVQVNNTLGSRLKESNYVFLKQQQAAYTYCLTYNRVTDRINLLFQKLNIIDIKL